MIAPLLHRMASDRVRRLVGAALHRAGYELVPRGDRHGELESEPEFRDLLARCAPYTATSVERMYALYQATRHVVRAGLDGDVVEAGVWRGGSAMLAALTLSRYGDAKRPVWLYDTYEGMSRPSQRDVDLHGRSAAREWESHPGHLSADIHCAASLVDVRTNLSAAGVALERCRFVRGKVEDTIPAQAPDAIALLRLDTDWYESTAHELRHLYPRLVPGGILIVDDYGHWQGARQAVDEHFAHDPRAPLLQRIDYTGRIAIKPG